MAGPAGARPQGSPSDPRAKLMQEVADEMDAIESEFGDDFEIGRVILVAEVIRPDEQVGLRVRAGQFPWVAMGMLSAALKTVELQMIGGPGPPE
jgi:hypothetical protein